MVDINLLIAIGGIILTLVFSVLANIRASKTSIKDEIEKAKADAHKQTRLETKLDEISSDTKDIKSDIRNMKNDIGSINERLIIVEQSTKSAHHRIDALTSDKQSE